MRTSSTPPGATLFAGWDPSASGACGYPPSIGDTVGCEGAACDCEEIFGVEEAALAELGAADDRGEAIEIEIDAPEATRSAFSALVRKGYAEVVGGDAFGADEPVVVRLTAKGRDVLGGLKNEAKARARDVSHEAFAMTDPANWQRDGSTWSYGPQYGKWRIRKEGARSFALYPPKPGTRISGGVVHLPPKDPTEGPREDKTYTTLEAACRAAAEMYVEREIDALGGVGDDAFGGIADIRRWVKYPNRGYEGKNEYELRASPKLHFKIEYQTRAPGYSIYARHPEDTGYARQRVFLNAYGDGSDTHISFFPSPQAAARAAALHYERRTGKPARDTLGAASLTSRGWRKVGSRLVRDDRDGRQWSIGKTHARGRFWWLLTGPHDPWGTRHETPTEAADLYDNLMRAR